MKTRHTYATPLLTCLSLLLFAQACLAQQIAVITESADILICDARNSELAAEKQLPFRPYSVDRAYRYEDTEKCLVHLTNHSLFLIDLASLTTKQIGEGEIIPDFAVTTSGQLVVKEFKQQSEMHLPFIETYWLYDVNMTSREQIETTPQNTYLHGNFPILSIEGGGFWIQETKKKKTFLKLPHSASELQLEEGYLYVLKHWLQDVCVIAKYPKKGSKSVLRTFFVFSSNKANPETYQTEGRVGPYLIRNDIIDFAELKEGYERTGSGQLLFISSGKRVNYDLKEGKILDIADNKVLWTSDKTDIRLSKLGDSGISEPLWTKSIDIAREKGEENIQDNFVFDAYIISPKSASVEASE